jgi:hypothetical protein
MQFYCRVLSTFWLNFKPQNADDSFSETLVVNDKTKWHHKPEECNIYENFRC